MLRRLSFNQYVVGFLAVGVIPTGLALGYAGTAGPSKEDLELELVS